MNLNPDGYNADLPGFDGTAALSPEQGFLGLSSDDDTSLIETLEGPQGTQTTLITLGVVGGVGLALLGLNTFIEHIPGRFGKKSVSEQAETEITDSTFNENQALGRHKTTAALAEQQSQLAQFETQDAPDTLSGADDAVEPRVSGTETPRFNARKVPSRPAPPPATVYTPPPVRTPAASPSIIPPPRLTPVDRRPVPPPPLGPRAMPAQPSTTPVVEALAVKEQNINIQPELVDTEPMLAVADPIFTTYRVAARLKEKVVLTEQLLAFGVSVPLTLDEVLPTLSGDIPAHSECQANVMPDRFGRGVLNMQLTACLSQGQVYPVTAESTMVLAPDLMPVRSQQTSVVDSGGAANLDDAIRETLEQAAVDGVQGLAREVLGNDILGSLAGSALETLTESITTDEAPIVNPNEPAYTLPAGMPLVVVSRAPVVHAAEQFPPAVLEPPLPIAPSPDVPLVDAHPPNDVVVLEQFPAPVRDIEPTEPLPVLGIEPVDTVSDVVLMPDRVPLPPMTEPEPLEARPRFHSDGQRMRTLEELLAPLQTEQQQTNPVSTDVNLNSDDESPIP